MVWAFLNSNWWMWTSAVVAVLGGLALTFPGATPAEWLKAKISDDFSVEMLVGVLLLISGVLATWNLLV